MDYEDLLKRAHAAAKLAAEAEEASPTHHWFPCGFAWVTISGTSPLARHCRKQLNNTNASNTYGDKGYPKGWQFWCPGHRSTQSMATYQQAAKAFAKVLAEAGIEATTDLRAD
jgi:hypothetical protein